MQGQYVFGPVKEEVTGAACYLVWPSLWQRSSACLSLYGLQSMSWRMTALADVRLMPRPPARVDSRNTKMSWSLLYSSINTILWDGAGVMGFHMETTCSFFRWKQVLINIIFIRGSGNLKDLRFILLQHVCPIIVFIEPQHS